MREHVARSRAIPGLGTLVNILTVLVGAGLGVLLGHRLPQRTRDLITDGLGLVTLLIAILTAWEVTSPALSSYVGDQAPMLIVLGALLAGGLAGSALRLEDRLEGLGAALQRRLVRDSGAEEEHRFTEGFLTASLVFCTGPLSILGPITEGLGGSSEMLLLKASLDGFAALAFAASFGWGVAASALTVLVYQGSLTLLGVALGDVLPEAHVAALTAVGGLLLIGIALRLLRIRQIPVADFLPALLVAPVLVALVGAW